MSNGVHYFRFKHKWELRRLSYRLHVMPGPCVNRKDCKRRVGEITKASGLSNVYGTKRVLGLLTTLPLCQQIWDFILFVPTFGLSFDPPPKQMCGRHTWKSVLHFTRICGRIPSLEIPSTSPVACITPFVMMYVLRESVALPPRGDMSSTASCDK